MAKAYEAQEAMWQLIAQKGTKIPALVWHFWKERFSDIIAQIEHLVDLDQGEIAIKNARLINEQMTLAMQFVRNAKTTAGEIHIEGENGYFSSEITELIKHYLGNDLYKISLYLDMSDPEPMPVPVETKIKVKTCIKQIKEFEDRLRSIALG